MPPGFISEHRVYAIKLQLNGEAIPLEWELSVNDQPLERILKKNAGYFRYSTEFFAGEIRLTLIGESKVRFDLQLIVEPDRYKLTRDDYSAMIADIRRSTLALYRLGKVTLPAPTSMSARRTTLITLELIRTHFGQFEAAIQRLARRPARLLTAYQHKVDVLKARRVDDRDIERALRSKSIRGANAAEARAAPKLVKALQGNWIPKLGETNRIETADLYEHRAILGFIKWLDAILLGFLEQTDNGLATDSSQLLRSRVERWRSRLARLARRDLFRKLKPDPALRATTRFRMNPDYASAFSAMNAMRAGLGDGDRIAPAVPIDKTFALYEMWCYIRLLKAATEMQPSTVVKVRELLQGLDDPSLLGFVLAGGDFSRIPLSPRHSLTYQRRFGPKIDAEGVYTHHLETIPDITISACNVEGQCCELAIFDPKYRVGSSLLNGLRDLHVYRDAILGNEGPLTKFAVAITPDGGTIGVAPKELAVDRPVAVTAKPGRESTVFSSLIEISTRI